MAATPTSDPRANDRGPMAHPAPRAARPSAAGALGRVPSPLAGALGAEACELAALGRRVVPNRRVAMLVGLALVALFALGGMAGAAEPKPAERSALEAFAGAPSPATPAAAAAPFRASSAPVAEASPALAPGASPSAALPPAVTTPASLADDPAFRGPDLLDLGAKTVLVLALLFITLRVLRRVQGAGPARGSGLLAVLETRPLGAKSQLHLVAIGDRRIIVGQSPAGLVALGELDAAELPLAEPVRDPWTRRDARDDDPELEAQAAQELASGRRPRLGISA